MSTISKRPGRTPAPTAPEPDPYRYGWRYVATTGPDGKKTFDQVPLTLEDVLHPEEGDFIVQSDPHDSDLMYLKAVFKERLKSDPSAVVLSDCRVDWNIPGVRPLGPDVAVFFGVKRFTMWSTFDVAEEGARPALVIEVTSPDTKVNDLTTKVDFYHRAGIPLYVIADVYLEDENERRIKFIAYRHQPGGYERLKIGRSNRVWLEPVGLWLGLTRDARGGYIRVACFDPTTNEEVGDYTAICEALSAAQETAEKESNARAQAEQARAEAEQARAQAEQARIAAERERALADERAQREAIAHADAARRIRELEDELKRAGRRKS